jgi:arylsulfatase
MWPRPLLYNNTVLEQPAQLETLTRRYTERAIDFISRSRNRPFFLYFPHTFPHIPLAASPDFQGKSGQGLYGDTVQEVDWSVGQVLDALKSMNLDDNTLVMFTSDNGPWHQGSPGRLRGRKGDTYEGGMRAPFIANWSGRIGAGQTVRSMATMLDIFPTVAKLAGASLPERIIDGVDIWPVLSGQRPDVDRDAFLFFNDEYLQCARLGSWKLHLSRFDTPMFVPAPNGRRNLRLPHPELYNVISDPEEAYDRSERNARIAADLQDRVERLIRTFPSGVIATYNDTMGTDVEETPIASLPVAKGH